jgi:hypothetical protein
MIEDDRKKLATAFIEALRARDAAKFVEIMTPEVVWTLPGSSRISGEAHGVAGIICHRSLQNQPVRVESKPATPRCLIHINFLDADKGFFIFSLLPPTLLGSRSIHLILFLKFIIPEVVPSHAVWLASKPPKVPVVSPNPRLWLWMSLAILIAPC